MSLALFSLDAVIGPILDLTFLSSEIEPISGALRLRVIPLPARWARASAVDRATFDRRLGISAFAAKIRDMKVISLQSGSNGNCFYVEAGDVKLLFDAGISGKKAEQRLAEHGRDIRAVEALIISHDHSDHVRSMGVFQRKFGFPVYVTRQTLGACYRSAKVGPLGNVRFFRAGDVIDFPGCQVHTVPTPHDSADGAAFVIEDSSGLRVGILTDLGHVFDGLRDVLRSLDAVIIESNYDDGMLEYGPYPEPLKKRIRGKGGHLSNLESAHVIDQIRTERLKWICLCHLSEENNEPDIARKTHQEIHGDELPVYVASRYGSSQVFEV